MTKSISWEFLEMPFLGPHPRPTTEPEIMGNGHTHLVWKTSSWSDSGATKTEEGDIELKIAVLRI